MLCVPQAWIKRPLLELEAIRERHDVVEGLAEDAQLRADLQGLHLRGERLLHTCCTICLHVAVCWGSGAGQGFTTTG